MRAGERPSPEIRVAILLRRYLAGEQSAEMTAMYCLKCRPDVDALVRDVEALLSHQGDTRTEANARLSNLLRLVEANRAGCERIVEMIRSGVDSDAPAASVDEGIAFARRLFDWSVQQSPESSVALYSLGSQDILQEATDEIVRALRRWNVLNASSRVLEIGCGTGRFQEALAPHIAAIVGIDISPNMVAAARRRCSGMSNVTIMQSNGCDLTPLRSASCDLVLAIDSFPYIVQAGMDLAERHFSEVRRVLTRHGELVILEFSYRGDLAIDRLDVARLATAHGFSVVENGAQPFHIWDGAVFRLSPAIR